MQNIIESVSSICSAKAGCSLAEILRQLPGCKESEIVGVLNTLLGSNEIEIFKCDGQLFYHSVSTEEASVFGSLNDDEKILYSCIRSSGNAGIWSRDLKTRASLHQAVLSKCLKSLESKKLIKPVKSAKNATRKLYMLYELEPASEISGGPWFTDFELDSEFIDGLATMSSKLIRQSISSIDEICISPISAYSLSLDQILVMIVDSNICNTQLSIDNVKSIVERIAFDGLVQISGLDESSDEWSTIFNRPDSLSLFGSNIGASYKY